MLQVLDKKAICRVAPQEEIDPAAVLSNLSMDCQSNPDEIALHNGLRETLYDPSPFWALSD